MATFYLINPVEVNKHKLSPGLLVDDGVTPTGPIEAAGGMLWTALDLFVADAGARASTSKARDDNTLEEIMQIGVFRSLKNHDDEENSAPVFTSQPYSQNVLGGAFVYLSVTTTGRPAPTYQWYKDGVAIPGATLSAYSIAAAAVGDAGAYYVIATNRIGSVQSDTATLTIVLTPLIINDLYFDFITYDGGTIYFSPYVVGAEPITYQWYKNGSPIPGEVFSYLYLSPVTPADEGSYYFIATNSYGSTQSNTVSAFVYTNVVVDVNPVDQTVLVNDSVTFTVSVTGNHLTYAWVFNDGFQQFIVGDNSPTLLIPSVQLTDAGTYYCYVSNPSNAAQSTVATLTVNP